MGKSSLLVKLLLRQEQSANPASVITFFIRDPGWRRPEEFLTSVNAQLLESLGRHGGTPSDLLSLRMQFSELWADALSAATAERPLLLVVDALDEMTRGETTIGDLLPTSLAPHVHVIVSSRPRPDPRAAVPDGHPLRDAPVMQLTAFDLFAVTKVLRNEGVAADLAEQIAPRVFTLTRGEPLFVRAVAEDVAARGEAALAALEDAPPAGAHDYFMRQLRAIDEAAQDDSTWRICEVLAAAKGALSIDEMAAILGLSRRAISKALPPIERFLVGTERVQFFHRMLYEAVQEEIGPHDLSKVSKRIIDWCASEQDRKWAEGAPLYALAHYSDHLDDIGEHERLQSLIDRNWLHEHRKAFGAPLFFVQDVERAIASAAAQQPPDLFNELRGSIAAGAARAVGTFAPPTAIEVLAALGREQEAAGYAELGNSDSTRAMAFAALPLGLVRAGHREQAKEMLGRALDAYSADKEGLYEKEIIALLESACAVLWGVEGLERLAALVARKHDAMNALIHSLRIAQRAAALGDTTWSAAVLAKGFAGIEFALAEYKRVGPPHMGDDDEEDHSTNPRFIARDAMRATPAALFEVVTLAAALGNHEALVRAEQMFEPVSRVAGVEAKICAALANAFAELDDQPRAKSWADGLKEVLRTHAPDSLYDEAGQTLIRLLRHASLSDCHDVVVDQAVQNIVYKGEVNTETLEWAITTATAAARTNVIGQLEQHAIALHDSGKENIEGPFVALVRSSAWLRDLSAVRMWVEYIELSDGSYRDAARADAVAYLAERKLLDDASVLAGEITDSHRRGRAYGAAALQALNAGQPSLASELADQAIASCGGLDDPGLRARFLASAANALFQYQPDRARELVGRARQLIELTLPGARTDSETRPIALGMVAAGDLDAAQEFAATIMEPGRTEALHAIALKLLERGEQARVQSIVDYLANDETDAYSHELTKRKIIAAELSRLSGDPDGAKRNALLAVEKYYDSQKYYHSHYADVLSRIITVLAKEGETDAIAELQQREVGDPDPNNPEASAVAAELAALNGDPDQARTIALNSIDVLEFDEEELYPKHFVLPQLARIAGTAAVPRLVEFKNSALAARPSMHREAYLLAIITALTAAGDRQEALTAMREALQPARANGIYPTLEIISENAFLIADQDQGNTLSAVCDEAEDILSWWTR